MPLYRYKISSPGLVTLRIDSYTRKRSVRDAAKYVNSTAESIRKNAGLEPGQVKWEVLRQTGHLRGWEVARHSEDYGMIHNGR